MFPPGTLPVEEVKSKAGKTITRVYWAKFDPPPNWSAWALPQQQPERLKQLDKAIADVTSRFLPREKLQENGIACPYYSIRYCIAVLAHECSEHFQHHERHVKESKKRQKLFEDAIKLIRQASECIDKSEIYRNLPLPEEVWFGYWDKNEFIQQCRSERDIDIADLLLLARVIVAAERRMNWEKETVQGSSAPSWRSLFIEGLGRVWCELTGNDPPHATSGPFIEFANAAFLSLDENNSLDDLTDAEFRNSFERTKGLNRKKGRHELNRFDATARWRERVNEQRRERFEYRLYLRKEYKREVDEGTCPYWMIESNEEELRREFDQAPPSEQDYFRSIGYSPDPAGDPNEDD